MPRHLSLIILITLLISSSNCSGAKTELTVEPMDLLVQDKFETTVPGFNGFLSQVADIDIGPDSRIYILDQIERHVVVLDSTLTAIIIIGRDGDGPGEIRIRRQSNNHHLAIGGGFVVIGSDPNLIHIFDMEGNFIRRFNPQLFICDLDVKEDGTIVTHTFDADAPIVEYDSQGNELGRYGRAVIRTGMGNANSPQFNMSNMGTISLLPDEEVVTFNTDWLWLGHYREDELLSEAMIDLVEMVRIASPSRENFKIARPQMKVLRQHSPDIINRAAESRPLNDDDFPRMTFMGSIRTDAVRGDVWGSFGIWLWQLTTDGHIQRVFECENGGSANFAIRDGYIAIGAGTRVAVGNIPPLPN